MDPDPQLKDDGKDTPADGRVVQKAEEADDNKALAEISKFMTPEGKFRLKVDGEQRELGPQEMLAELQKDMAGDKRLREASQMVEQSKKAMDVMEAIQKAKTGDQDAYRQVASELYGLTAEEADEFLEEMRGGGASAKGEAEEKEKSKSKSKPPVKDPEIERMKVRERERERKEIRDAIFAEVHKGVDNDPRFATVVKAGGGAANAVQKLAKAFVRLRIGLDGEQNGPVVYGRVLDDLHQTLKDLGIQGDRKPLPAGAGVSPGPTGGVVVHPEKPIERVSATEKGYGEFVQDRLARIAMEMEAE